MSEWMLIMRDCGWVGVFFGWTRVGETFLMGEWRWVGVGGGIFWVGVGGLTFIMGGEGWRYILGGWG